MGIMDILVFAVLVVAAIGLAVAVVALTAWRRRRALRDSFGPEYGRMLWECGSHRAADAEARRRQEAYAELDVMPLSFDDLRYYTKSWDRVQATAAAHPVSALKNADHLVRSVLVDRGYPCAPVELFALLSVEHGTALSGYRNARLLLLEMQESPVTVSTDQLRDAFSACGRMFDELLMDADVPHTRTAKGRTLWFATG
jgi:hypothetical protein